MAPENELLSSWREELRQQASQGPGREELEEEGEDGGPKVLPCSACQEKGVDIDYEVHAGTYKSYLATQV